MILFAPGRVMNMHEHAHIRIAPFGRLTRSLVRFRFRFDCGIVTAFAVANTLHQTQIMGMLMQ